MVDNYNGFNLHLRVQSNAKRFCVCGFDPEKNALKLRVKSPAVKGKANKEIVDELKGIFNSDARIVKGEKSNKKIVWVELQKQEALKKLKQAIAL